MDVRERGYGRQGQDKKTLDNFHIFIIIILNIQIILNIYGNLNVERR